MKRDYDLYFWMGVLSARRIMEKRVNYLSETSERGIGSLAALNEREELFTDDYCTIITVTI